MIREQLKKNEVNFQILSDQSNDAIVILYGLEVIYCNPKFEKLIKYSHNKIISQSILNFIIDSDRKEVVKYFEKHLRENKTIRPYKTQLISKDNKKINIKIKPSLISYHSKKASLLVIHKISEHKQTERKIRHLNTVLRSILNINQLITREKDPIRLIQGSCDTLVNSGGYTAAWIAVCNKDKKYIHFVESGIGKSFNSFCKNFSEANSPEFVQYALKQNNPVSNCKRENICCTDYSLLKNTTDQCVLMYRLQYKNQLYGILAVHVSQEYIDMCEERELLQEIGDDISFALYGIELEEELKQRREHFRSIYENSTIGMYRTTPKGEIIRANPALVKMLGYSSFQELQQRDLEKEGFEPEYQRRTFKQIISKEGSVVGLESVWKRKDGKRIFIRESATAFKDRSGKIIYYEGTVEDITQQKQIEEQLINAESERRTILDAQLEHVIYEDTEMKILWPNQAACDSVNMKREELIGRYCYEIWPKRKTPCVDCPVIEAIRTGKPHSIEKQTPDGRFWFIRGYPVQNSNKEIIGAIEVTLDITRRKLAEKQVKKDLEEKSILLKEIHHRVKNNLQVMRSLIHLQQIHEKNTVFQDCATKLSNRILSMALIHEQLYSSEGIAQVNLKNYFKSLLTKIKQSYIYKQITIEQHIADVYLPLDFSIPLGLIVNELITNALKYAFQNKEKGKIIIRFIQKKDYCLLQIQDNGIGMPIEIDIKEPDTLGFKLVSILTTQLDGTIHINRKKGTNIEVYFPITKIAYS